MVRHVNIFLWQYFMRLIAYNYIYRPYSDILMINHLGFGKSRDDAYGREYTKQRMNQWIYYIRKCFVLLVIPIMLCLSVLKTVEALDKSVIVLYVSGNPGDALFESMYIRRIHKQMNMLFQFRRLILTHLKLFTPLPRHVHCFSPVNLLCRIFWFRLILNFLCILRNTLHVIAMQWWRAMRSCEIRKWAWLFC